MSANIDPLSPNLCKESFDEMFAKFFLYISTLPLRCYFNVNACLYCVIVRSLRVRFLSILNLRCALQRVAASGVESADHWETA